MTKAFGLSGSAAVHPCLFCETTSTDMQKEPSNRVEPWIRNLRRLKSQNQRYVQAGSIKKNARHYKNAISEPIWDIELTHVAPPYLHIVLGIVKKHHDLLEEECHKLDIDIALNLKEPKKQTMKNTTLPYKDFARSRPVKDVKYLMKKKRKKERFLNKTSQKKQIKRLQVEHTASLS